jgi:hypothetical protein
MLNLIGNAAEDVLKDFLLLNVFRPQDMRMLRVIRPEAGEDKVLPPIAGLRRSVRILRL